MSVNKAVRNGLLHNGGESQRERAVHRDKLRRKPAVGRRMAQGLVRQCQWFSGRS